MSHELGGTVFVTQSSTFTGKHCGEMMTQKQADTQVNTQVEMQKMDGGPIMHFASLKNQSPSLQTNHIKFGDVHLNAE